MSRRVDFMLGGEDFKKMTAAHVMQTDVYYFSEESPAIDLVSAMTLGGFGSVPITTSQDVVVGIVSEFDLLEAIREGKDLRQVKASEIMTQEAISVDEDTPVDKIVSLLQAKHLIRVPVVDKNGILIGIVARRDILLGYLKSVDSPPRMAYNLL